MWRGCHVKCDMCGSEETLYNTVIEGAEMTVCKSCSDYGKVKSRVKVEKTPNKKKKEKKKVPERKKIITIINEDYPKKIKQAREKKGFDQSEFAEKIAEKASVIHQLETGHMEPSIALARKLEKALNISLVEEYEEKESVSEKKSSSGTLTIGDMIKVN